MSRFAEICDWMIEDVVANVPACRSAIQHRYAPWDPMELRARAKERHIACWPVPEAQVAEPLAIGGHRLRSAFAFLYWEHAGDDSAKSRVSVRAVAQMFDTHDAIVGRLYEYQNQIIAPESGEGSFKVWYDSTALPERSGTVRWFGIGFNVDRVKEFV